MASSALLEGLGKRPAAASALVEDALKRFDSAERIALILGRAYRERPQQQATSKGQGQPPKRKKRKTKKGTARKITTTAVESSSISNTDKPTSASSPCWLHWLLECLYSPSLAIRQVVIRILHAHALRDVRLLHALKKVISMQSQPHPGDVQTFGLVLQCTTTATEQKKTFLWACTLLNSEWAYACPFPRWTYQRFYLTLHLLHFFLSNGNEQAFLQHIYAHKNHLSFLIATHVRLHTLKHLPKYMDPVLQWLKKLVDPHSATTLTTKGAKSSKARRVTTTANDATNDVVAEDAVVAMEEDDHADDDEDVIDDEKDDDDDDDDDDDEQDEEDEGEQEDEDEEDNEEEENGEEDEAEAHEEVEEAESEEDQEYETEQQQEDMMEVENDHEITDIVDIVRQFEERLLDVNDAATEAGTTPESRPTSSHGALAAACNVRKDTFVEAAMQILNSQYPAAPPNNNSSPRKETFGQLQRQYLSITAEQYLLKSICHVVKPPKKPVNIKIFMRRAPSQEEFFRGSLARNPIQLSHLSTTEPTVRDLRQYIADKLQMSETAELIEILCANKILNLDLKLRVIQLMVWKPNLIENSSSVSSALLGGVGSGAPTLFATGSGLSMVFNPDRGGGSEGRRSSITADTPAAGLPPMVVTYRLAGVDGEATEDIVDRLVDPEAPNAAMSPEEQERMLEKEYGLTRLATDGRGIHVLLRSIQQRVRDSLRRIRRDDVLFKRLDRGKRSEKNLAAAKFEKDQPCPGLLLLSHCTKLPSNCKKLVDARAPTIMLRLLLDVLNVIDDSSSSDAETTTDQNALVVKNPTAILIEQLIETLASDISSEEDTTEDDLETDQGSSTLPLLLSSLKTIYLGPQLRKVIAKLLPFLTYGQTNLARQLADHFVSHIRLEKLCDCEASEQPRTRRFVLMDTFVQAAVLLPPSAVCHSLRSELMKCGFVEKLTKYILADMPEQPPPWSQALWKKSADKKDLADLEQSWRYYFLHAGVRTAFEMLTGLCRRHVELQNFVAQFDNSRFIRTCHWIEVTSDNRAKGILQKGLALHAEALLDELKEGNEESESLINSIRRQTRQRKKEIADERKNAALVGMSAFGSVTGAQERPNPGSEDRSVGGTIASSILAPVLDFFSSGSPAGDSGSKVAKPAWMTEMEALEDEEGLTCAVCQEGKMLQPGELLGLYAYVKKISIPHGKCGSVGNLDGSALLMNLPYLPASLIDTPVHHQWYQLAKSSGDSLRESFSRTSTNRRPAPFTTTVSGLTAIHCSCHQKAKNADRMHPKAPKSEWEGASLRNSRVQCNVILPLVSSKSSKVPLVQVDNALTDFQTAVSNLLGARPKSMLWSVLHDVRLLILRMSYGEPLGEDCGGGSLTSNTNLIFHQLLLADMFFLDAVIDSPATSRHCLSLSGGFLAANSILAADDYDSASNSTHMSVLRAYADAAPMAALTCILRHNTKEESSEKGESATDAVTPHAKRRWEANKEAFLRGLIVWGGRRHALGIDDSGCVTSRKGTRSTRANSFSDWEMIDDSRDNSESMSSSVATTNRRVNSSVLGKRSISQIDDFGSILRPVITLYVVFDALSATYVPNVSDESISDGAAFVVDKVEKCQKSKSIHELLGLAGVTLDHDEIVSELQRGMISA